MLCCPGRSLFRTTAVVALLGAVGLGAATLVAGPDRVGALFSQVRGTVNEQIDQAITDPVALRAQLRALQEQYPVRIGQVRSDLGQLRAQASQLNRELAVSARVVELTDSDIRSLTAGVEQAQEARMTELALAPVSHSGSPIEHQFLIVFKNERLPIDDAQGKLNQVTATRNAYSQRAADITRDLGYLAQQERQLASLLTKLEGEQTAFQTQMFDLDRQIDSVSRNERMIDVLADRQRTLDEQSRYRASSLDQLTGKLADLRAKQEAQLSSLVQMSDHFSYEDAAKLEIDRQGADAARTQTPAPFSPKPVRKVIEITPDPTRAPAPATGTSAAPSDTAVAQPVACTPRR